MTVIDSLPMFATYARDSSGEKVTMWDLSWWVGKASRSSTVSRSKTKTWLE